MVFVISEYTRESTLFFKEDILVAEIMDHTVTEAKWGLKREVKNTTLMNSYIF